MPEPRAKRLIESLTKKDLMRLITPNKVWVAIIEYDDARPTIFVSSISEDSLYGQVARYCRRNAVERIDGEIPPDVSDQDVVHTYFGLRDDEEWLETEAMDLHGPLTDPLWVAIIEHRHGHDLLVAPDQGELTARVADWCRTWWAEAQRYMHVEEPVEPPDDPQTLIHAYFEHRGDAFLTTASVHPDA